MRAPLAFDRQGSGPPLVLLHGTNSARTVWRPVLAPLVAARDVIAVDLPAHGHSPPTSLTPPGFARDVACLLDALELEAPTVVGHSAGGWTALELAKLGRAGAVLALAPAGLWRRHSPRITDVNLTSSWLLGQLLGRRVERSLGRPVGRRLGLRGISARPGDVPADVAVEAARTAVASRYFPQHFRRTRGLRFEGGASIPPEVPVRVIWGDADRVAPAGRSRFKDRLPPHARVETWPECGHMIMWDRPRELVAAALSLPAPGAPPVSPA